MIDNRALVSKNNSISEWIGRLKQVVILIYLLSFSGQQFYIDYVSPIRPYMIFGVFALIVLLIFYHKIKTRRSSPLDYSVLIFYNILILLVFHSSNIVDSSRLYFGIFILVTTYLIFTWWLSSVSLADFEYIFYIFSLLFIRISFVWYIWGIYLIYSSSGAGFGDSMVPHSLVAGAYLEGGIYPRLRGLTDSPNNYSMYFLLIWIWLCDRNCKISFTDRMIVSISVLATFSATLYLILILYYIFRASSNIKYVLILVGTVSAILFTFNLFVDHTGEYGLRELLLDRVERLSGGSGRLDLFENSIPIILEKPFFGHGLNSARDLLQETRDVRSTHNNLLELGMEGGVFAIFAYLLLLFSQIFAGIRIKNILGIKFTLHGCFAYAFFGMSNVNIYADSYVLLLAVSSFYFSLSYSKYTVKN